jgi:hypothetical protein
LFSGPFPASLGRAISAIIGTLTCTDTKPVG